LYYYLLFIGFPGRAIDHRNTAGDYSAPPLGRLACQQSKVRASKDQSGENALQGTAHCLSSRTSFPPFMHTSIKRSTQDTRSDRPKPPNGRTFRQKRLPWASYAKMHFLCILTYSSTTPLEKEQARFKTCLLNPSVISACGHFYGYAVTLPGTPIPRHTICCRYYCSHQSQQFFLEVSLMRKTGNSNCRCLY